MESVSVLLSTKKAQGYVSSLGLFNLVWVKTDVGMVGCGAFDVMGLDKFTYPAARVRSASGGTIATVDDLLLGIVREVNLSGQNRGIQVGMTGREALERL